MVSSDQAHNQLDGSSLCQPKERPEARAQARRVEAIVREHMDFVWRLVRRMGVPEQVADDATQQVFIVAAQHIEKIKTGSEQSFLFGTALRVASETRRSLRRRRDFPLGEGSVELERDPGPGPEELLDRRRAGEMLDQAMDRMDDDCRQVFVLFEFEQMTSPEIAHLVGIPLGTVASRLRRAREVFQNAVEQLEAGHRHGGDSP